MSNLTEQISDEIHMKLTCPNDFLSKKEFIAFVFLINFISYHIVHHKGMIGRYTQSNPHHTKVSNYGTHDRENEQGLHCSHFKAYESLDQMYHTGDISDWMIWNRSPF